MKNTKANGYEKIQISTIKTNCVQLSKRICQIILTIDSCLKQFFKTKSK